MHGRRSDSICLPSFSPFLFCPLSLFVLIPHFAGLSSTHGISSSVVLSPSSITGFLSSFRDSPFCHRISMFSTRSHFLCVCAVCFSMFKSYHYFITFSLSLSVCRSYFETRFPFPVNRSPSFKVFVSRVYSSMKLITSLRCSKYAFVSPVSVPSSFVFVSFSSWSLPMSVRTIFVTAEVVSRVFITTGVSSGHLQVVLHLSLDSFFSSLIFLSLSFSCLNH